MNLKKILPKDGQLIMCLGGSSGTGKSRVINAFVKFSHRWHSTTYVVVTASSGVVAFLIGGFTIHGALGI
jgi:putative ribosome biogenesis GTPase RsgA